MSGNCDGASPARASAAALREVLTENGWSAPSGLTTMAYDLCPVLDFAYSGAMWLTGSDLGSPNWPDGPLMSHVRSAISVIHGYGLQRGHELDVRVDEVLSGRSGERHFRRRGQISVGEKCHIIRGHDSWLAVTLAREDDLRMVPVIVEGDGSGDPWNDLHEYARKMSAHEFVERCRTVGVAAAVLAARRSDQDIPRPFSVQALGSPCDRVTQTPLVVDLTSMWAGPLCAHMLGRCGARIVKVESIGRPDGARVGDATMFDRLHSGHELVSLDFESSTDLALLRRLVDGADVVLESSRPRALRQLGISAENFVASRPGRTWLSVTGYGRTEDSSNFVAFGDDAAVAAGLVAYDDVTPMFCADAIADPLAGLYATIAALGSMIFGGGHLIDVTLRGSAAYANSGFSCPATHLVEPFGDDWRVGSGTRWAKVARPRAPRGAECVPMITRRAELVLGEKIGPAFQ